MAASRVIGSQLRYLRYDRLHRTFPRVVVTAFCITAVFSTANILGVRIYFIRKLCRKVLVAVAQSAEWTAADRPFGTDTAPARKLLKYPHVLEAFRPAARPLLQTTAQDADSRSSSHSSEQILHQMYSYKPRNEHIDCLYAFKLCKVSRRGRGKHISIIH
jgi:hypothetical protein